MNQIEELEEFNSRIAELEAENADFSSTLNNLNRIFSSPITDDDLVRLHMSEISAAAAAADTGEDNEED